MFLKLVIKLINPLMAKYILTLEMSKSEKNKCLLEKSKVEDLEH